MKYERSRTKLRWWKQTCQSEKRMTFGFLSLSLLCRLYSSPCLPASEIGLLFYLLFFFCSTAVECLALTKITWICIVKCPLPICNFIGEQKSNEFIFFTQQNTHSHYKRVLGKVGKTVGKKIMSCMWANIYIF